MNGMAMMRTTTSRERIIPRFTNRRMASTSAVARDMRVAGVFFVVEREADVLQLVVKQVAAVEGDLLRQGFGGVGAGEIAEPAAQADAQNADAVEH